jgi:hypothetical protein
MKLAQTFLTEKTLLAAGFNSNQAAALATTGITASDLAGAVGVTEAGGSHAGINGTAGAMSNALDRSDVVKDGVTQQGLSKSDNKLLSMVTTPGAYEVLSRADKMKEITSLLALRSSLVSEWIADFNSIRNGGVNPVGDHRAFWVNVGSSHGGKNHMPTYNDSGGVHNVTSDMRGGCLVIGGLCFRDTYHATPNVTP